MLLLLGLGYALFDLPAEPLMIISTVFAGFLVIKLGHCYLDILDAISEKIAKTMPALLILITVGLLIGTWISGGTIPMMIYYGLKAISPEYLYVTALFLTAIVSICTGTLGVSRDCWCGIYGSCDWIRRQFGCYGRCCGR